jgi:hypothetical protein
MHHFLRRAGAVTLLAMGAALAPSACARDDSSIFIAGVMIGTQSNGICTYTPQAMPTFLLAGSIDAAFAGQYVGVLQVENQIVSRGSPNTLRTETSYVNIYEAEVQVLDPTQGMAAISQYSVPATGFLTVGMAGQPGLGASAVVMVDAATVQALGARAAATGTEQQVVSSVVLKGRTLGDLEEHTQEFLYPITIAYGSSCSSVPGMPCISSTATTMMTLCTPGQDGPITCQEIASTLGPCKTLECDVNPGTGRSDLTTAHCPSHIPIDMSCCNP